MGFGISHLLRKDVNSSPEFPDTLLIEANPLVQREKMATRRQVENREDYISAESQLTPEMVSRFITSAQDVQELANLLPSMLEHQNALEATINCQYQSRERSRQTVREDHAHVSESNVENISSSNRPSSLETKYDDFYDHDRIDAIDFIEKSRETTNSDFNQMTDSRIACIIFEEAYHAALNSRKRFLERMSSIVFTAPTIGSSHLRRKDLSYVINADECQTSLLSQEVQNHLKVIMKETSDICDVSALVKKVEDDLKARQNEGIIKGYEAGLFSKPEMKKYIMECCKYAWLLVCQTPPYVLETRQSIIESDTMFDSSRHHVTREFKQPGGYPGSGQFIQHVVWPGLFVGSPPRVIRRTEVTLEDYV